MKKLIAPSETIVIDLSKHQDNIDFENSSSSPEFILGWAKIERIGDCIYRVYGAFNNKIPNAYMLTYTPFQTTKHAVNNSSEYYA